MYTHKKSEVLSRCTTAYMAYQFILRKTDILMAYHYKAVLDYILQMKSGTKKSVLHINIITPL